MAGYRREATEYSAGEWNGVFGGCVSAPDRRCRGARHRGSVMGERMRPEETVRSTGDGGAKAAAVGRQALPGRCSVSLYPMAQYPFGSAKKRRS